jgi:hypothetical protein
VTRAFVIEADGEREPVPAEAALAAASDGVVVLEGALQELRYLDPIADLYFEGIADLVSADVASAVRADGLEHLHHHLTADQVAALLQELDKRAVPFAITLSRALAGITTDGKTPYFICSRIWIRALVPMSELETSPAIRDAKHLTGHVKPAAPHRDYALTHPYGTISLWAAIGPVRAGNSMTLFEMGDGDGTFVPEVAPGDVVMFNTDRLHATVPNETDETRVSVTTRIVQGRRLRYGPGDHWRPFYDARLLDTPLEPLATTQSRLTLAAARRWRARRRWARQQA